MNYPVVIHKDPRSDYGVTVPDLPGCFSAGKTIDEALALAKEAIELHVEGLIEDGEAVPPARPIDEHQRHPDYRGGTWAVVAIDPDNLRFKAIRLNITMPERVVERVDQYARQHGQTRSGLLVAAVTQYMQKEPTKPKPRNVKPARKR